jgi:hypothetical protein
MEFSVAKQTKDLPSALKHGGFAGTTILPGENKAAFNKLHDDLCAELGPNGPLEVDIVMTIARLVWRKQNLKIYHLVQEASARFAEVTSTEFQPKTVPASVANGKPSVDEILEQARSVMGHTDWELSELADDVTIDNLLNELTVIDRLDGMIDRCLKRLLMVRGVKSLAAPPESSRSQKRLSAA